MSFLRDAFMIVYMRENGYGNVDLDEVRKVIEEVPGSANRVRLLELLYDYEVLRNVVDGKNCIFRHEDRSETRRLKLY